MEVVPCTDDGTTEVASKLPEWHILAVVVGTEKQSLLAW